MRLTVIAFSVLLFCGLASAQIGVIGGTAGYWPYAGPFVPLITTPSVSWAPAIPTSAGARNGTWGNHVGARNATAETLPAVEYNQPIRFDRDFHEERAHEVRINEPEGHEYGTRESNDNERPRIFRTGIAVADFNHGLASMINKSSTATKASRTYTNQDVTRMNDANGTVKYSGKTGHI